MSSQPAPPLGTMTVEAFLAGVWQRRPALLRGAFADFVDPIDPDDLGGLAMEPAAEARLVHRTGDGPADYAVDHGPFTEAVLAALPVRGWSLLVQAADCWMPAVARLRERFAFLPAWRVDDIMVSFAAPQGGVGPHFDHYDVFLIQGMGSRRWRVGGRCDGDTRLQPHPDLKLLPGFEPVEDWVLEPGDMLYIPPGFAHDGVAIEPSLTYSVGFRAPSAEQALLGLAGAVADREGEFARFADPGRPPVAGAGAHIGAADLDRLRELMRRMIDDEERLADWFARFVTEPKIEDLLDTMPTEDAIGLLGSVDSLALDPAARAATVSDRDGGLVLYVNGEAYAVPTDQAAWVEAFAAGETVPRPLDPAGQTLAAWLFTVGGVMTGEDEDG